LVIAGGAIRSLPSGAFEWTQLTQLSEEAYTPTISADAKFVVFASRWDYPNHAYKRLRIVDVLSRQTRTLIEGFADYYQPVLSHDGRTVLFLSNDPLDNSGVFAPPQAFVIGVQRDSLRRLTNDIYGIVSAILSGDGRVVYAQSKSGRIVRVDVDSGTQTELLPPSLQVFSKSPLVAGSRVDLEALDDPAFKILIDGQPVDLTRVAPGRFSFVLPFELAGRTVRLSAESDMPAGPFEPQTFDFEPMIGSWQPRVYEAAAEYGGPGGRG